MTTALVRLSNQKWTFCDFKCEVVHALKFSPVNPHNNTLKNWQVDSAQYNSIISNARALTEGELEVSQPTWLPASYRSVDH